MLGMRPDIIYAVNKVTQYSTGYGNAHWTTVKWIFRYIKGTADYTLVLGGYDNDLSGRNVRLTGACDADWANDLDDRRSTTGYLFYINGGCISWQIRKQTSVATSSTQAEYQALSTATKEAVWLRELLNELRYAQTDPTPIYQDNQSTIALAYNPVNHGRTKHIDIQHHFIRECVENRTICLEYLPTKRMTVDVLTKALPRTKFEPCIENMGLMGPTE